VTATIQWQAALDRANAVRIENSEFKKSLACLSYTEARVRVADAISDGIVESSPVNSLLLAIPRMGARKTRKLLLKAGVFNERRKVRDLTRRQRDLIVRELLGWPT
jgi:hypothetical protein